VQISANTKCHFGQAAAAVPVRTLRVASPVREGQDRIRNPDSVDAIGHLARPRDGHLGHVARCLTTS